MPYLYVRKSDGLIATGWPDIDNPTTCETDDEIVRRGRTVMRGLNLNDWEIVEYIGEIPDDIYLYGKYILSDTEVIPNPNYTEEEP